jgi:ATP-dependent DNA ligase
VILFNRRGLDWTKRFRTIAADVARLPTKQLVIDGEVIVADEEVRISGTSGRQRSKISSFCSRGRTSLPPQP